MSLLSRIIALMLWPLETLGRLLAGSVRFLAVFSGKLLRSPWGLLVPVTFLAVLFLAVQLDKGPRELALHYALELEQADESRRRVLVAALLDLGDPGIEGLVQGLRSRREAVFLACREALEHELNRWETLDDPSERSRRYRVLSETLSENAREFRPVARTTALAMTQRMLQYLATSAREIEHTPPPTGYQSIRQETQRGWYRDRASARRQYPRDSRFAPDLAKHREFLSRSRRLVI